MQVLEVVVHHDYNLSSLCKVMVDGALQATWTSYWIWFHGGPTGKRVAGKCRGGLLLSSYTFGVMGVFFSARYFGGYDCTPKWGVGTLGVFISVRYFGGYDCTPKWGVGTPGVFIFVGYFGGYYFTPKWGVEY